MAGPRKPRNRAYGVMVRLHPAQSWLWITPTGGVTRNTAEAAGWHGPDAEAKALEAAKFISKTNPGLAVRTTRKPSK